MDCSRLLAAIATQASFAGLCRVSWESSSLNPIFRDPNRPSWVEIRRMQGPYFTLGRSEHLSSVLSLL